MCAAAGKGRCHDQRRPLVLASFMLLASLLALAAGCRATAPVVKIGLVAPFEGRHRPVGYDVIYSVRLAVRQANAAGGINGYRVALVALDDGGETAQATAAANALVQDPNVIAVAGHWGAATTAEAAPIYAAARLPFLALTDDAYLEPEALPADFRAAYEAVTPFDETPGPYAGPAYDALQALLAAAAEASAGGRSLTRATLWETLENSPWRGISGMIRP